MTTFSPILGIQEVAPTQSDKETTINTATVILEAASNDSVVVDFSGGDVAATATQWKRYFMLVFDGATAPRTLSVPATKRFNVFNNTTIYDITVGVTGLAGALIVVPAGKIVLAQCDGVDIRAVSSGVSLVQDLGDVDYSTPPTNDQILVFDSGTSKWVPQTSPTTFIGLSDTPGNYTSAALKFVRVNAGHTALEYHVPVLVDISDINAPTPVNGDSLVYNTGTGKWDAGIPVYQTAPLTINTYTADHTLDLTDTNALVRMNKATAVNLTIPPNSTTAQPVGAQISVVGRGVGLVTLVAGAGVTLLKPSDLTLVFRMQHSGVTLIQEAIDEWAVIGDLGT